MPPSEGHDSSSLFHCRRCGIQTRHRWHRWNRPLPLRLISGSKQTEGWICNECGRRVQVRKVQ